MNRFSFYFLFATGLSLLFPALLSAQVENVPIESKALQALINLPTWECETVSVAPPDVETLRKENEAQPIETESQRIARFVPTSISSLNSGSWYTNNGVHYWVLKVHSDRAQSLYVFFDNFKMQDKEALFLLNHERSQLSGPYNNKNVHSSLNYIFSDAVTGSDVYVVFKSTTRNNVPIRIQGIGYAESSTMVGQCKDILCPAGNCWRIEAQSIARIQYFDGTAILEHATGTLINSVGGDPEPYIITARHIIYDSGCSANVIQSDPANMKFIFYSWNTVCDGTELNTSTLSFQGAELITDGCCMDVALLRLLTDPREGGSSLNTGLVYAGWDTDASPPKSGALLHYPSNFTDPQTSARALNISLAYTEATTENKDGCTDNLWGVTWTVGGVKFGSSGASYFNEANHKIAGTESQVVGLPICVPALTLHGKFHHSYFGDVGTFSHGGLKDYLGTLPTGQTSASATMTIDGPEVIIPSESAVYSLNFMAPLPPTGYIFEWTTDMSNIVLTPSASGTTCSAVATDLVAGSGHIMVKIKTDGNTACGNGQSTDIEILTSQKKVCVNVYYISTTDNGPYVNPLPVNHHQEYELWLTPVANVSILGIYYQGFYNDPIEGCKETTGNPIRFNHYLPKPFRVVYNLHYDYDGCVGDAYTSKVINTSTTSGGQNCTFFVQPDDRSDLKPESNSFEKSKLSASPNPFSGNTTIGILNGSPESYYTVQAFDIMGRIVQAATEVNPDRTFDLGINWPAGTYRVMLFRDGVVEHELTLIKKGF